ncbi:hypothetical protein [Sphingopyxis sp. DBS4]|uniref:hypothetical protein n=1 Tax=Sphingopyxis sp. DBS4 TaxID=2968500 RepID=UPI00214B1BCC|nr:hypothetical protein [Sphingopyxis sp. DBS4]
MAGGIFNFYRNCARRAFTGWFKRVEGWASTVALLVAIILLFVTLPASIEAALKDAPTWFFLAVFVGLVVFRLILAPYQLFSDEHAAREAIERARRPLLELALPDPPLIQSVHLQGNTSESLGGTRQTTVTGWELDVAALTCFNAGEQVAEECRARLMSVMKIAIAGEEHLRVITPVLLPWEKEDPETHLVTDIAPSETRRIWIGGVRGSGHIWLFRSAKSLPLEHQQLLGEPGTYRLLIQVDGKNIPPQQIELEIIAEAGERPANGIQRGKAEVSVRGRGAPRIGESVAA